MKRMFMIFICVCIIFSGVYTTMAEVQVGTTKEYVLEEWGKPASSRISGNKEFFIYLDGREARFENGKVIEIIGTVATTTSTTIPPEQVKKPSQTRTRTQKRTKSAPQKEKGNAVAAPPPAEKVETKVEAPQPEQAPAPVEAKPGNYADVVKKLGDPNNGVRANAEKEITRIGKPALDDLIVFYRDSQSSLVGRVAAVDMIGKIMGPPAADIFIPALTNKYSAALPEMVTFLTPLKDRRAVEPLLRLVETADYSPDLRRKIYIALGEIGDPKCLNMLMFRFKMETDEIAQVEMANAMDKITGEKHYYNVQARLDWIDKNHPEWLKEGGPVSYKTPEKSYVKVFAIGAGGAALCLFLIYRFWKSVFKR